MTETNTAPAAPEAPAGIDPRGPRFGAAVTAALVLLGVYLAGIGSLINPRASLIERIADPGFIVLLLVAILFSWSLLAPRSQPVAAFFRRVVQPKLKPPTELEDPRPPRFAQGVGLVVVGIGLILHLIGVPWALVIAGGAAFVAAFLNAVFAFCLGCEIYLLLQRAGAGRRAA